MSIHFDRDRDRRENDDFRRGGHGADPNAVKDGIRDMVLDERRDVIRPTLQKALERGFAPQKPEEGWGERASRALSFARSVAHWIHSGRLEDQRPSFLDD